MHLIKGVDVGIDVVGRLLDLETIGNRIAITISCPVYWYAGGFLTCGGSRDRALEACDSGCGDP